MKTASANAAQRRETSSSAAAGGMIMNAKTGSAPMAYVVTDTASAKVRKRPIDQKRVR